MTWRGGSATETKRSRASQEPSLLLGKRHARISGDNIGRFREINFRDSRPWAAGLSILEVDPVASEAVEVLLSLAEVLLSLAEVILSLAEVLLSSIPPDGDLSGALKVQKTPVRVQAVADIFKHRRLRACRGRRKFRFGWWWRRIIGIARGRPRRRWWRNHWHTTGQQPKRYSNCKDSRKQSRRKAHATRRSHKRVLRNSFADPRPIVAQ
jgi:hypothetical protein